MTIFRIVLGVYIAIALAVTLMSCNSSNSRTAGQSDTVRTENTEQNSPLNETHNTGRDGVELTNFKRYFDEAGVHGTFLLYSPDRKIMECYNCERADSAYTPASTFKIFNSLVALETGVIQSERDTIAWDRVVRNREGWDQSQDIRAAFKYSTVWFYQELARRIGRDKMKHYIDAAGYGNRDISGPIDRFWLDGKMAITPRQQIDLLERLHNNDLPFSQRTMDIVKDIMINERTGDAVLRAKTGTAIRTTGICWWVGYVEKGKDVWYFAINLDMKDNIDAMMKIRKEIVRRILADRGIFPQT